MAFTSHYSDVMETHEYGRIAKRESFYFWHVGRREILREALSRALGGRKDLKILDYGCGPGGNILFLKDFGNVLGADISPTAIEFAKTRGFEKLVKVSDHTVPFPDAVFDIVSSLDVFEHIDVDEAAMWECSRVLKPGGVLLVTVPAHRWLWSNHDVALRHFRRYSRRGLLQKLRGAGFQIVEWSHFVTTAVPINLIRKARDGVSQTPSKDVDTYDIEFSPFVNSALLFILRLERIIIRFLPIPFGSSLFIIAKKL